MMSIFKRKSPQEKLQLKYQQLMKESFQLSTSNRAKADEKVAEAQKVLEQIRELEQAQKN